MGKTRLNEKYAEFTIANHLTNHLEYKPGECAEVDWSDTTMHYLDLNTGELITVYLFVGTLPYSQYLYIEPYLDMKMNTFIRCHIRMYEYFGGAPARTVCDNLKTGIVSHPKEGEIILTDDYAALDSPYMTAIIPAGIRKLKQKPSIEGTIGKIAIAVIARCRNDMYYSFAELKKVVADKLYKFNRDAFQKRESSRYEILKEEQVSLSISVCEKKVDLKITDRFVEIYHKDERLTTYNRFPDYIKNMYSTHPENMPSAFRSIVQWDDERIRNWAGSIGKSTLEVIDRIFGRVSIKEQGYNPCLAVLRLSRTYTDARLETAYELAISRGIKVPRYHHLKAILVSISGNATTRYGGWSRVRSCVFQKPISMISCISTSVR